MFYTREIKKEEINYLVDIARLQQEVCFTDINTFYTDEELLKSYYIEEVLKGNDLVWGAFLDDKLIGGCFFYAYKNSLYMSVVLYNNTNQSPTYIFYKGYNK